MDSNGTYSTPYAAITSTDHGGPLLIVNLVGLFISFFSVGVRIYLANRDRDKGWAVFKDDLLCFIALVRHSTPTFRKRSSSE
jgi:hypothetical protein